MGILDRFRRRQSIPANPTAGTETLPGERWPNSTERGLRATPEAAIERMYRSMWVDFGLRETIMEIRRMDKLDTRVKRLHQRTARAAAKGGLKLKAAGQPKWLQREWEQFRTRLHLDYREKLESDLRGLMMEGNLPLQWVLDQNQTQVLAGVRMPSETMVPLVDEQGTFTDPAKAYRQHDIYTGGTLADFALWQISLARMNPDNYDDWGCLGRPYLDAARAVWKKLTMTEEDLVIRRGMRAPLRMVHVLEGAEETALKDYRAEVERDQAAGNYRDYYLNRKGSVAPVQGDANLDQIADVVHLLDTFFAGAPAPKGLFGYTDNLARDVLEDLKKDFFEEVDAMQDLVSRSYQSGFALHLLLRGRNPDAYDYKIEFAERVTETPNQRADLALKYQALELPRSFVWDSAGIDVAAADRAKKDEERERGPYPDGDEGAPTDGTTPGAKPRVAVTPGNGRKGESDTTISTRH